MEKYQWNNSLSVGINLIDQQHKMLIQRLNDVATAIEKGQGVNQIVKTLEFLMDYTEFHFSTEEKHMEAYNYHGMAYHKQNHEQLKDTLNDLERDFKEEGATYQLADALNTFLHNWLITHIKGIDIQFGDFLKEKNIELPEDI